MPTAEKRELDRVSALALEILPIAGLAIVVRFGKVGNRTSAETATYQVVEVPE